jgi:uncharacterized damage-inducible protein DinB
MQITHPAADPRYPIGRIEFPHEPLTAERREELIERIAETPHLLREAVAGLDDAQLDTPYRDGGWTVRQLVHHIPDSHINSYTRFRLALTEDTPTIKPYDEAAWAKLPDTAMPIEASLELLEALHRRWVALLRALDDDQWHRALKHPEMGPQTLERLLIIYAWHGPHHIAHITALRDRMGW